jgi:hypothetical protein
MSTFSEIFLLRVSASSGSVLTADIWPTAVYKGPIHLIEAFCSLYPSRLAISVRLGTAPVVRLQERKANFLDRSVS